MTIVLCVFVALLYTSVECNHFRFDYSYDNEVEGWFKYYQVPATWHDAWLRCHLEGGVLASPYNMQMNLAMSNVMKRKQVEQNEVFTGINSVLSKGDYSSIEGYPLSKMILKWMPGEPNNRNNDEECIVFALNGTVADVNCDEVYPYMCFKKKTNAKLVTGCGTFDPEYRLEPRTGSCYKFHSVAKNWTRAYKTCMAEGGHLAIINSATEAKVLKEIFDRYPEKSIIGLPNILRNVLLVGFQSRVEPGLFVTIDGKSLEEAGYSSWGENQPDNTSPGQYCGAMFRNNALLDDVWCYERGVFICEKTPNSLLNDEL